MDQTSVISSAEAINSLKAGEIVAIPTETVYGLAARIDDAKAIQKIFETKKRPFFDPLIVHIDEWQSAKDLASNWSSELDVLAKNFWPGPLTLVLPKKSHISEVITSGLLTVGIRCPNHPVAQEIIRGVGVPLAAPSANLFGQTSPTTAQHVVEEFGGEVRVVDGGQSDVGIESTVLTPKYDSEQNIESWSILRPGTIERNQIAKALNIPIEQINYRSSLAAPGNVQIHYQPAIPLITFLGPHGDHEVESCVAENGFSKDEVNVVRIVDEPVQFARRMYSLMREASSGGSRAIAFLVDSYEENEAWRPIKDRLTRASVEIFFT